MPLSPYARLGATQNPAPSQTVRQHVLIASEELPIVACKEYGGGYDAEQWRVIAEYNAIDDLDALTRGAVLKIPNPTAAV